MIRRSLRRLKWHNSISQAHPVKATPQDSRGCTHSRMTLAGSGAGMICACARGQP